MRLDLDQERPGAPGVSFTLTSRGGAMFADITGANVGRRLATRIPRLAPILTPRRLGD